MKEDVKTIKCEMKVEGMHCAACEILIEKKFSKSGLVQNVDAELDKSKISFEVKEGNDITEIKKGLSKLIEKDGYKLKEIEKIQTKVIFDKSNLIKGFIIATIFFIIFLILQQLGIANIPDTEEINLPFILLIGVLASFSSCMAVVGGLVISLSANLAKQNSKNSKMAIILFHLSRLAAFFILGGLIGFLGSILKINSTFFLFINALVFIAMLITGINLLNIFPSLKKFQVKTPKAISKKAFFTDLALSKATPLLLGALTFILPCGFTQSMQLYALSTGSIINSAIIMLVFAIGTFPVLALISFASVKFSKTFNSPLFYSAAGFIVIFFAVFNMYSVLTANGFIKSF